MLFLPLPGDGKEGLQINACREVQVGNEEVHEST